MYPAALKPERSAAGRTARVSATVFGLDVRSRVPLGFLEGSPTRPTGRTLSIEAQTDEATKLGWPNSAELICGEPDHDGDVLFRIETHPVAGYLISGREHGLGLLAADGRRLLCDPEHSVSEEWQRLLVAQMLPFAALLQGLEVFHAAAVAWHGAAIALLGPSGEGKTSVSLELCRQGAVFITDDVLALEARDGRLLAHPGAPLAGLDHAEAGRLELVGRGRREEVVATNERERLLRMSGICEPAPLAGLFFLERRRDGPGHPRFEAIEDAGPLLGATFNFVLATPERLRGLLDVCALAARCRAERVLAGPSVDATQLAYAIAQHLDESL